jgi:hypothetical protein
MLWEQRRMTEYYWRKEVRKGITYYCHIAGLNANDALCGESLEYSNVATKEDPGEEGCMRCTCAIVGIALGNSED